MGAAAHALATGLERLFGTVGLAAQLATGLLPVIAGVALYLGLTQALRVGEADALLSLVTRLRPRA
jgi:hypothetical protein